MNTKAKIVIASLSGFFIGSIMTGYAVFYFVTQFCNYGYALNSSNQLNFNIWALDNIRSGESDIAISRLEQEARVNLISVGAFEELVGKEAKEAIYNSIVNAKQYFEKHPIEYMNKNEKELVEQAYKQIER